MCVLGPDLRLLEESAGHEALLSYLVGRATPLLSLEQGRYRRLGAIFGEPWTSACFSTLYLLWSTARPRPTPERLASCGVLRS